MTSTSAENILKKEIDPAFARRARIITSQLELKSGQIVADIGCGRGFYEQLLSISHKTVNIVGIDANASYIAAARKHFKAKNVRFLTTNAEKIPLPSHSVDRVICTEVLEHVKDDSIVMSEIRRILKPNGIAVLTVPHAKYPFLWDPINWILERLFHFHIPSHIWWLAGIWADHQRLYTKSMLHSVCRDCGFVPKKWWYATRYSMPFSHFLLYGIGKNLVEKGICPNESRFDLNSELSMFGKLAHAYMYAIDGFNTDDSIDSERSSVNLIVVVQKIEKKS